MAEPLGEGRWPRFEKGAEVLHAKAARVAAMRAQLSEISDGANERLLP